MVSSGGQPGRPHATSETVTGMSSPSRKRARVQASMCPMASSRPRSGRERERMRGGTSARPESGPDAFAARGDRGVFAAVIPVSLSEAMPVLRTAPQIPGLHLSHWERSASVSEPGEGFRFCGRYRVPFHIRPNPSPDFLAPLENRRLPQGEVKKTAIGAMGANRKDSTAQPAPANTALDRPPLGPTLPANFVAPTGGSLSGGKSPGGREDGPEQDRNPRIPDARHPGGQRPHEDGGRRDLRDRRQALRRSEEHTSRDHGAREHRRHRQGRPRV